MKYSKTAIGLLTAQYRSVLKKCWLINVGLFFVGAAIATPAQAADGDILTGSTLVLSGETVSSGHLNIEGMATTSYVTSQLSTYTTTTLPGEVQAEISNQITSSTGSIRSAITNATTDMATQTWADNRFLDSGEVSDAITAAVTGDDATLALRGSSITTTGAAHFGNTLTVTAGGASITGDVTVLSGGVTASSGTITGRGISAGTGGISSTGAISSTGNINVGTGNKITLNATSGNISTSGVISTGGIELKGSDNSIYTPFKPVVILRLPVIWFLLQVMLQQRPVVLRPDPEQYMLL